MNKQYTFNTDIVSSHFEVEGSQIRLKNETLKQVGNRWISLDLKWTPIEGAKSYGLMIIDYEASRVVGQPFIHWVAANIKTNYLEEGANIDAKGHVNGVNSTSPGKTDDTEGVLIESIPGGFKATTIHTASDYFPPAPPDKPHQYTIKVFGLDVEDLDVKAPFFIGDWYNKALTHVVGIRSLNFWFCPDHEKK
ncbi:YbhB/YbcL family Raf kinase inhibitor-like protein [[Mycoplasma] testudinis]|uniref:YbhB/YbcL family Raf kinase inhibitor-like protein n=1 Tax=[Mycoplasma] testudinis TaxID=33924 RepID=UPI00048789F8|nr:YbhB/YbcL family Raf kinase inhibitor-like protein [[Mycoplasma] testudinis]